MNEKTIVFLLSFASGFVDTAGVIALGGVFTAHVTGNFVLAGASLASAHSDGVFVKLIMFPIFVAAIGASYLASCFLERRKNNPLFFLMLAAAVFLLAFAVTGFYFQPNSAVKMTESEVIVAGALGVVAMAIQNAFMKLHLSKLTMTTVMTGNVTQFSIDLTKLIFGVFHPSENTENNSEIKTRLKKVGAALLGFLFGAIGGAFLFFQFALLSIVLPCVLILLLAFWLKNSAETHPN